MNAKGHPLNTLLRIPPIRQRILHPRLSLHVLNNCLDTRSAKRKYVRLMWCNCGAENTSPLDRPSASQHFLFRNSGGKELNRAVKKTRDPNAIENFNG